MTCQNDRGTPPETGKMQRQAGVCLHISSLPGPHGIGTLGEHAGDFAGQLAQMGVGVWQFLPLGPTAYGDSPYQPLSAFAGNPNLLDLAGLERLGLLRGHELEPMCALPRRYCDFGRLIGVKNELLSRAAERFNKSAGHALLTAYEEFLHDNAESWLDDYALFRVIKSAHAERPWPEWDTPLRRRQAAALDHARNRLRPLVEHQRVIQFLFDLQWRELQSHARDNGVKLFGDLPIYLALDSADAWAHPELLLIDRDGRPSRVAGVPPDYFSEDGQLWGNPLYDWEHHRDTGYRWWLQRLRHAGRQMQLVRIDHFRGFEAYWSVEYGASTARDGRWEPGPGDAFFTAVRQTIDGLAIVAEDLGVITPAVEKLRLDHGIPGMIVLQYKVDDPDFDYESIPENSVCYTGTHDNDTTLGWFLGSGDDKRSKAEIRRTRANALKLTGGEARNIHRDMVGLAFDSRSRLACVPMQDLLGMGSEARMNRPGTAMDNWRWRMRETDLQHDTAEWVAALARETGRAGA